MKIEELKDRFSKGLMTKPEYQKMMFDKHKVLFEYADQIKKTGLAQINISDEGVIFTSREHGIKFLLENPDGGIAPIAMFNMGSYEKVEAEMCLSLIKPGFTIFDVGGNVGWFSMLMSKHIDHLNIYCFEPMPETFMKLNKNIIINECAGNITTFNFGFYSDDTEMDFYYDSECSGKTSAANIFEEDVNVVKSKMRKLDSFVSEQKIKNIDFIKCDVEGGEYFVFQGGSETLDTFKPMVFTEMLRKWSAKFGYHPNQIIKFFREKGYSCFVIDGIKIKRFLEMTDNTLETNFIFLHDKKHEELIAQKCI